VPLEVREATILDEPGRTLVDELWVELGIRYADDPTAPEPKGETDDLEPHELLPPTGCFLVVADDDGTPVGCGAIRRHDDDAAEIKRMYVRPAARGRGISRFLLGRLEAAARMLGYRAIVLETGLRQPEAIALYESAGYTVTPNFGFFADSALSVCYRKELDG
jgi:GNAT superfamily N-acetyltransferase